ncbi:MAG: DUF1080 domain-containing protein [Candidatus Hydrogenedentes bacterium]|nr:DUF1080 domain-containing protein [Candidatus Hydrogenedentota bacterium]
MRSAILLMTITFAALAVQAQTNSGYRIHDMERAEAPVVTPGQNGSPPADAIVLFDGTNLDAWRTKEGGPAAWKVADGYMETVAGADDIFTKQEFGDCQLHIEWASPADPAGKIDQDRGNSGIFFMEKYEIQVLDSYQNRTYSDGHAGSVYAQFPPQVNATRPPGEWQTYDIVFRAPRFKKDGAVKRPARITAFLNGVLVQDNVALTGPTGWLQQKPYEKHADAMSIKLQDHDSPVRFRNIWIRPLPQREHLKKIKMKTREAKVELSTDQLDRFTGAYETIDPDDEKKEVPFIVIRREGNQLLAAIRDKQEWPLFPQSETEFVFETFDGTLTFVQDEKGAVTGVNFRVGIEPDFEKKL